MGYELENIVIGRHEFFAGTVKRPKAEVFLLIYRIFHRNWKNRSHRNLMYGLIHIGQIFS